MSIMKRKIVHIDEERCDGCGECVPSCAEGAILLSGGKARLAADALCDGLGACLGECPRGAITVVEREAEAFDEAEVARRTGHGVPPQATAQVAACPAPPRRGLSVVSAPAGPAARGGSGPLGNWPVQLRLVPEGAPFLAGAELLVAADCVPLAYPAFHAELLAGRKVVVGCPKLDALPAYAEKLAHVLARPDGPVSVTVARMEVPCCAGITAAVRHAVEHAAASAGREVPVREVVIGVDGVRRG
jgi:NAD-dependent dihydropyrimidine dehydrogenase PreA subunit